MLSQYVFFLFFVFLLILVGVEKIIFNLKIDIKFREFIANERVENDVRGAHTVKRTLENSVKFETIHNGVVLYGKGGRDARA